MKKRRFVSFLLIAALLLSVVHVEPLSTAEAASISTDFLTYSYGSPVYVTAVSDASDAWVGIYHVNDTPETDNSIYWYYVNQDGHTSGTAVNIKQTTYNSTRSEYEGLPAGEYKIILFADSGYTVVQTVNISVTATVLFTDATSYAAGSPIYVNATASASDAWVGIYHVNDTPETVNSIYWYYVNQDGHTSGNAVNIKETTYNSTRGEYAGIPAGEYKIILFADEGYTITESVNITVSASSAVPSAPTAITYTRTTNKVGFADGSVTVTLDKNSANAATDIVMYFADSSGTPISGYSYLQKQPVGAGASYVSFNMVSNTIIPKGAKKLIAYASNSAGLSSGYAAVDLPDGASDYDFGTPLSKFQVISDSHITTNNSHTHSQHFTAVLNDIKANCSGSSGLVIVGDVTDTGVDQEYQNIMALYNNIQGAPKMYWSIGNHDFSLNRGDTATQINRFLSYCGESNVYYDKWIDGNHFIFLGSESTDTSSGVSAYVSNEQLSWLEAKMAENHKTGRPIFIYMHQAIYNTVAGSLPGQGWDGIGSVGSVDTQEAKLKAILAKYPEAIYFSGHSHWELNSVGTMYAATSDMCNAFNTASSGYLWTSYGNTYSGGYDYDSPTGGSQGYYVEVYSDKVLVRGRDFETGLWMPSAYFCVDLSAYNSTGIEDGLVTGSSVANIDEGTTVSDVISKYNGIFDTSSVKVLKADGTAAANNAVIATGMTLVIGDESYPVVVAGDVDGDGDVTVLDAQDVISYIRTGGTLSGITLEAAAAMCGTATVNIVNVTEIINSVLGI